MRKYVMALAVVFIALLSVRAAAQYDPFKEVLLISFDNVESLDEYEAWRGLTFENVMIWAVPQYPPIDRYDPDDTEGGAWSYPNGICAGNCKSGTGSIYFSPDMELNMVTIYALSGPGIDFISSNVRLEAYDYDGTLLGVAEASDDVQWEQLTIIAPMIGRLDLTCGGNEDSWDDLVLYGNPCVATENTSFGAIKMMFK